MTRVQELDDLCEDWDADYREAEEHRRARIRERVESFKETEG